MQGNPTLNPPGERGLGRGTVAVDFDGVLSRYGGRPLAPPQEPVFGAAEALRRLKQEGFRVLVFSSREPGQVRPFLAEHQIPFDVVVAGRMQKPLYHVLVDDRAITFDGNWDDAIRRITSFQPYWRRM